LNNKLGLLRIAGLDGLSEKDLAAVIRAELGNDYIYRLQMNVDDTLQFSMILELFRGDGTPVKLSVGLKYLPRAKTLNLVTLT
jgi:hypothetical protein